MKIETLLHTLALVLAAFALGLHVASRLLFPEAGMTGSLPVWLLLLCTGVLCGSGRKRTDVNESENPQPLKIKSSTRGDPEALLPAAGTSRQ